jgi:quercetin dioxygenase-like cupin family protein
MAFSTRRVVTGLGLDGRSCVVFDGQVDELPGADMRALPSIHGYELWKSEDVPASNEGDEDQCGFLDPGHFETHGSVLVAMDLAPSDDPPWMHATNSLDYVIVLRGRVLLTLENGSAELSAGDVIVDRGVVHGWSAIGGPAQLVGVSVKAHPLLAPSA